MVDAGVTHKQRVQSVAHEIWKATGYRFTCVLASLQRTYECLTAYIVLKIIPNSLMAIKRVSGALRTKPIDLNLQERRGSSRATATNLASPALGRSWRKTDIPVGVVCLSLHETLVFQEPVV